MDPVGILKASTRKVRTVRKRRMAVLMALVHSHIQRPVLMAPRAWSTGAGARRSTSASGPLAALGTGGVEDSSMEYVACCGRSLRGDAAGWRVDAVHAMRAAVPPQTSPHSPPSVHESRQPCSSLIGRSSAAATSALESQEAPSRLVFTHP